MLMHTAYQYIGSDYHADSALIVGGDSGPATSVN